jgi:hypothetical protein
VRASRITSLILTILVVGMILGCGGCGTGREKGKNSDIDRPKSTAK